MPVSLVSLDKPKASRPKQKVNRKMQTRLITLQVPIQAPPSELRSALPGSDLLRSDALRSHIETQLATHGDPLRWAITAIDTDSQTACVEAVVTAIAS